MQHNMTAFVLHCSFMIQRDGGCCEIRFCSSPLFALGVFYFEVRIANYCLNFNFKA